MGRAKQASGPNCRCKIVDVLTEIKGGETGILRLAEIPIVPLKKIPTFKMQIELSYLFSEKDEEIIL